MVESYDREIAAAFNPANAGKADEADPADESVANPAVIRDLARAIRDNLSADPALAKDPAALDKRVNDELHAAVRDAHLRYDRGGGAYSSDDPVDSVSYNLRATLDELRSQKEATLSTGGIEQHAKTMPPASADPNRPSGLPPEGGVTPSSGMGQTTSPAKHQR